MRATEIRTAGRILAEAWNNGRRLDGLPESCRPESLDDAYLIQDAVVAAIGLEVVGWKVGATSLDIQRLVNSTEPVIGPVLSGRTTPTGAQLDSSLYAPRGLEGEIAFELGADLPPRSAPYSLEEVAAAISSIRPAVEVISTRLSAGLAGGLPAFVADLCGSGTLVLADDVLPLDTDLDEITVEVSIDGSPVGSGTGRDVIGGPLAILRWLADRRRTSDGLRAGQIISTGTCTGVTWAPPQCSVTGTFQGDDRVRFRFA